MRIQSMPAALLGFSMLAVAQPSTAADPLWRGSYAAEGACYCLGALDQSIHRAIVPTPVGGQSVKQVCERIGSGPTLTRSAGVFNYPVYSDAQCGHGPGDVSLGASGDCYGSLNPESGDCQGIGPSWNLEAAYASPTESSKLTAGNNAVEASSDVYVAKSEPVRETIKSTLLSEPVVTTATETDASGKQLKATIIRSQSAAAHASENLPDGQTSANAEHSELQTASSINVSASSGSPAGRSVVIDGQAYRQARSDVPASGGSPGSRIILDGLVFLRDDGNLDPSDLYAVPTRKSVAQTVVAPAPSKAKNPSAPDAVAESTDQNESEEVRYQRLLAEARKRLRTQQQLEDNPVTASDTQQAVPTESETLAVETDDTSLAVPDADKVREPTVAAANTLPETDSHGDEENAVAVTETAEQVGTPDASSGSLSALRLPSAIRASSRDFDYVDALPTTFDFGGGGLSLEASADSHSRFHYLGRASLANSYQEVLLGGGYYLTPPNADRLTVVLTAGLEYGNHEFSDEGRNLSAESSDTGVFLGLSSRVVVNRHFEFQGGAGYSSFFDGDPVLFGSGFIHINRQIDLVSRFELGDNDSLGLGIRFYY